MNVYILCPTASPRPKPKGTYKGTGRADHADVLYTIILRSTTQYERRITKRHRRAQRSFRHVSPLLLAGTEGIWPQSHFTMKPLIKKIANFDAKKWQERKETLDALETLAKNPKLENGDYGEVVRALKIISKDVPMCRWSHWRENAWLHSLAVGLKKRFQSYAAACMSVCYSRKIPWEEAADALLTYTESISINVILENIMLLLWKTRIQLRAYSTRN